MERSGQINAAQTVYKRILELDKQNVDAMTLLGLLEVRANKPFLAIPYFEKALRIAPKSAELHNNLAMLLLHLNRPDKAEPHALHSYKINPNAAETLKILFKCYYHLGKAKQARFYINKAMELQPGNPEFKLDLAQCYDTTGEPDKARQLFQELIQSGHGTIYAYDGLARTQKYNSEPPELAHINQLISDSNTPADDRAWLHRIAGKITDDLEHHDAAFEHYLASKSPQQAYGYLESFIQYVSTMKEAVTPAFFSERRDFGLRIKRPIFVFGMPRSGTTLVEQILASHPDIHGANELNFFRNEANRLSLNVGDTSFFMESLEKFKRTEAQELARDYLMLLTAYSNSAERVIDKMPHNFESLWLLALLFPQASFIHCRRDPVATCVSCFTQPLGEQHAYVEDLAALGKYYRQYQDLMSHWHKVLPINIMDINYEQLVTDQEAQIRRMVAHVGLNWNDACLRSHEIRRDVRTPSRRQVEQPIYTSSIQGWRRYEKHLGPLIEALGDLAQTGKTHAVQA